MFKLLLRSAGALFGLVIFILFGALFVHESVRWRECSTQCKTQWDANQRLLSTEMCAARWRYGDKAEQACVVAEKENELSHFSCTARSFWLQSELYRVYTMYTHSYWMLLGITVPCLLYAMHLVSAHWAQKRLESMMQEQHDKLQSAKLELNPHSYHPPTETLGFQPFDYNFQVKPVERTYVRAKRPRANNYVELAGEE